MNVMKDYMKDLLMKIIRMMLHIFFIFPIKNNRIMFECYLGKQFTCNPKYIYKGLVEDKDDYEIIWSFNNPEKYSFLEEDGTKLVKTNSIRYWYYRFTSKVTVTNVIWRNITPIRKGQYEIQTWHGGGGGYKKTLANDKEQQANKLALKRHMENFERYSLVLTSSETSHRTNARMAMQYKGLVLGGTPRNDILINKDKPELDRRVREFFSLGMDVRIALYAPTWRNNATKDYFDIDYLKVKRTLEERFGGKWIVLRRLHMNAASFFKDDSSDYIKAEAYPDMQELLYVVDVLITDYSSSIWDYSFTKKPCFLLCFDLENYKENRDFYNPISTWGFPVAKSNEELVENIMKFNQNKYELEMDRQHDKNTSYETGQATENVCKVIRSVCYENGILPEGLPYLRD